MKNVFGHRSVHMMIVIAALLFLPFTSVFAATADWTFMVYLDADNDLESYGIQDFMEMASVGSTENVNIVVQFDRIPGYDTSNGDWTDCNRYLVTAGMAPTAANAVQNLGEVNMADPATLTAFIDWATAAYPANNYALVLWNHGGGWRQQLEALQKSLDVARTEGERAALTAQMASVKEKNETGYKAVCWDDTSGDTLYTKEVRAALEGAGPAVTLLGFDACLMSMIEVAYEMSMAGPVVMVGSEELEPGPGWPYDLVLGDLAGSPGMTPAALGTAIVDRYYESYGSSEVQAAIDLTQMSTLAGNLSTLAGTMMSSWDTDQAAVQAAAQGVMTAMDTAVIAEQHGTGWPGANGLAIFFPATAGAFDPDYNHTVIQFANDTLWDEFLPDFHNLMQGSWIDVARLYSQQFDTPEHVDLYDFCEQLVNPSAVCPAYTVDDTVPYSFEDISGTGTNLGLSDDGSATVPLGFTFDFYCTGYTSVIIGDNGSLSFEGLAPGWQNECLPGATNSATIVAPFWDDFEPVVAGGAVFIEFRGTAPDRRLIIQWNTMAHFDLGDTDTVTFQAVLYEGSNNILFQYLDTDFGNPSYTNGASATVGIQSGLADGALYSCNTASVSGGQAILFSPGMPAVPFENDVVLDFGSGTGVWVNYNDNRARGSGWRRIHRFSSEIMENGDLDDDGMDEVILDFGSATGVWANYNDDPASWRKIHAISPELMAVGDLDNDGQGEVILDFGSGTGVWANYNDDPTSWRMIHALSPEVMAVGDLDDSGLDEVIFDFGSGTGVWAIYDDNPLQWRMLHSGSPEQMMVGDLDDDAKDEVIMDFGSAGVWANYNDEPGTWRRIHTFSPETMAVGDLDGSGRDEVILDFGSGIGVWANYNDDPAAWRMLHGLSPEGMSVGDLDDTGLDDVVLDFGSGIGVWVNYDDDPSSWRMIHSFDPELVSVGNSDGN